MELETKYIEIDKLTPWGKNPRRVEAKEFQRLLRQLEWNRATMGESFQTKPLIVVQEGERYTVLGGNTRLLAFREMGITEVWCTIVDAPTDDIKLRYALSDNESAGYTVKNLMLPLLQQYGDDIPLEDHKINLGFTQSLDQLSAKFGPSTNLDNDDELDEGMSMQIKKVVLNYEGEEFKTTLERLNALRSQWKMNDFSEVVIRLISFYENHK